MLDPGRAQLLKVNGLILGSIAVFRPLGVWVFVIQIMKNPS